MEVFLAGGGMESGSGGRGRGTEDGEERGAASADDPQRERRRRSRGRFFQRFDDADDAATSFLQSMDWLLSVCSGGGGARRRSDEEDDSEGLQCYFFLPGLYL